MNMKEHILAALLEQFERWEKLLATLNEEKITAPHFDLDWSIKDVIAHLWGWQQISIARMQSGVLDREPEFPKWVTELRNVWEEDSNQTQGFTRIFMNRLGQKSIRIGEMDFYVSWNWGTKSQKKTC